MERERSWQEILPHKYLSKACRWGIGLCVVVLLAVGFRLLVTISLMVTTYVVWTKKMIILFSIQSVLLISVLAQIRAYACLWKKKGKLSDKAVQQGLNLLCAANIGKMIWCLLAAGECWWIGSSAALWSFYQQTLHITVRDLALTVCVLLCRTAGYGIELLCLHTLRKSLNGQGRPSRMILRLTSYAVVGQYVTLLLLAAVFLMDKVPWPVLLSLVPLFVLLFFFYYDPAACYYRLSKNVMNRCRQVSCEE